MATANAETLEEVNMASSFKGPPSIVTDYIRVMNESANDHDSASSSHIYALSEDFEHVMSGHLMSDGVSTSQHDYNIEADRPEISMQIRNVEHALQSLTEGGVSEITAHLSQLVPKIIRLERKFKMQTTLRGIFEETNQHLKLKVDETKEENASLREEISKLQDEVSELKKSKEDEQLGGFDFVTKKEAREIKDAEKKDTDKQQPVTAATTGISEEVHFTLQRKYNTLKKQLEEIVKVNHSWDEHYRNMKTQLEARNEDLQRKLTDAENQTLSKKEQQEGDQKAKDDILVQAKIRVERAEKERGGALAEVVAVNQKCEKLERYARTLTGQRNEMEKEIKRLNEALAQKLNSSVKQSATVHSENLSSQSESIYGSASVTNQGVGKCNQKGVDEMTESEIKEELELLRQQTEVFQSDFFNERQDRQRVMGELDAVQKELRRTKKQLQQTEHEQVIYMGDEDARLANQLHRDERLHYKLDRPYSTSAPQQRYYVSSDRPPARYVNRPLYQKEQGGLIAHGRGRRVYNTAGNDVYIDGDQEDSLQTNQIDGNEQDNMICPRCESSFSNDRDYHIHISGCMND